MRHLAVAVSCLLLAAPPASGQTPSGTGAIQGTVFDTTGSVLPGVTVIVTSEESGIERALVTNEDGLFRALLLPLGTYRVAAQVPGFKRFEQPGTHVSAGGATVVDITLQPGDVTETITVNASEHPDPGVGRVDGRRNMTAREVRNLPLVSRNPYNFALVQHGVSGFENPEFGVPRIGANGTLMRVNYQIDGNTNTEKDRAGLRLLPMSEVMVQEVQVVTTAYAPEFGRTMGVVYNAITPSGTNAVRGDAAYLFRRKAFSAYPFFFDRSRPGATKPDTSVDTVAATLGGPAVRDRLLYYAGYERTARDLSASRVVAITAEEAVALGLDPQPGAIPATQAATFFIGKADYQVARAHRATVRHLLFRNDSPFNGSAGGRNSLERATDFLDSMHSTALHVVTTLGNRQLNELRVQHAKRTQSSIRNGSSGSGPAVDVSGIRFGSPLFGAGQDNDGFAFEQRIFQLTNNYTLLRGSHNYKIGADFQSVRDGRTSAPVHSYVFPSIGAYQAARSGLDPFAYAQFTQLVGDLSFEMSTKLYGVYAQDDWQLTPSLKVLYGIRYDRYRVPEARADSPFPSSRAFSGDTNNWGPRAAAAWAVGDSTVIRASTGLMYDQPVLAIYENALQLNGSPAVVAVNLGPGSPGAPAFPASISGAPAGATAPTPSIVTVDPEFRVAKAWQTSVQVERSFARDYTITAAYVFARQTALPTVTDINLIDPVGELADGRPVFSGAVNAATRADPRFDHVYAVQSIGDGTCNALTLALARRFSRGAQLNLSYTLGKGQDNAPLNNGIPGGVGLAVNGDDPRSDPTNLDRDRGPNLLDVRHSFTGSIVYTPSAPLSNRVLDALANGNQIGVLMQFNSGLPFNVRTSTDLNRDGLTGNDRPLFVGRNSMNLPARYNVDLRYSRIIPVRASLRAEVIAEFKNLFNSEQTAAVNSVVPVDPAGNPATPLPSSGSGFTPTAGYESRQFQLGFRVRF